MNRNIPVVLLASVEPLLPRRRVIPLWSARVMLCCLRPDTEGSASVSGFCFEATSGLWSQGMAPLGL